MGQNSLTKELQDDPRTYVESVGKYDKQAVVEALQDSGEATALRLAIGASNGEIPLRALSYIASARAVRELYLPKAQLQIVHPIRAASRANGVSMDTTSKQALRLRAAASILLDGHDDDEYNQRLTYLIDEPVHQKDRLDVRVSGVLAGDEKISATLGHSALRRSGNMVSYVASHVRVHDRPYGLEPIDRYFCGLPAVVDRVVSIGAQSERAFYAARMACRQAGIAPQTETGQLFSKHVLPPYQQCRYGEPAITEIANRPWDVFLPDDIPVQHDVTSVARDLAYLKSEFARGGTLDIGLGFDIRRHLIWEEAL